MPGLFEEPWRELVWNGEREGVADVGKGKGWLGRMADYIGPL